ncbi:hypothetical protein LT493_39305 [Streptomyces tricolor]|nr:hypothetical protein [Streptomyces tricolor]
MPDTPFAPRDPRQRTRIVPAQRAGRAAPRDHPDRYGPRPSRTAPGSTRPWTSC